MGPALDAKGFRITHQHPFLCPGTVLSRCPVHLLRAFTTVPFQPHTFVQMKVLPSCPGFVAPFCLLRTSYRVSLAFFSNPMIGANFLRSSWPCYAVSITILAYQSTRFDPAKIYIWTPLMLGGDVAALIHLIKEQFRDKDGDYETVAEKGEEEETTRPTSSAL